jgi:hypothetical protein
VAVFLAAVFLAGLVVVLRGLLVVLAMVWLRPAGVLGVGGAPVLVVGEEGEGGDADGEGDAVRPGHGSVLVTG